LTYFFGYVSQPELSCFTALLLRGCVLFFPGQFRFVFVSLMSGYLCSWHPCCKPFHDRSFLGSTYSTVCLAPEPVPYLSVFSLLLRVGWSRRRDSAPSRVSLSPARAGFCLPSGRVPPKLFTGDHVVFVTADGFSNSVGSIVLFAGAVLSSMVGHCPHFLGAPIFFSWIVSLSSDRSYEGRGNGYWY